MTARNLIALLAPGVVSAVLLGCADDGSMESTGRTTDAAGSLGPATVPDQITMREAVELADHLRALVPSAERAVWSLMAKIDVLTKGDA